MTFAVIALLLSTVLTAPAFAAPGDPRLVQGTLEWPATLTREPVIVVRGDDGHAYYCDVTDAVRHRADGLRAGGRLSVLGIEASKSHEITSIVIGTGDAATLVRALSQARQVSPGGAAAAAPPAPAPDQPVASTTPPAPAVAPSPSAAPAAVITSPGSPATAPTPGTPSAQTPTVVPTTVTTAPAVATTSPPPRRTVGPAASVSGGGRGQWSRLDGMVESVAGSTLTLKTDEGAVAYVDISQLSPNVAQVLRQGTVVTVYGYPVEQKFEAAGYIQTNPGGPEPKAPARTNR